ncbi:MAG: neutral/alkaline non-lysosomal ceramidase N-terminal domain-containing protein, partial [Acidobacteriota bacterium]
MWTIRRAVLIALCAWAAQAAGDWKAGVAKVVITPREPIWLAGYGARTRPSEGVLHDLYAKALAFEDETGATSVLVTTDLLGFTRDMAATVAGRVEQKYGVVRARLALTSSHTHSGPVTGQLLRPAYVLEDDQAAVVTRYTGWLLDQVVEVIGRAIADLKPAQLAFEQGLAGFAVNRRRVGLRHLPGPVDHDVPVLAVRDLEGKLRAVVFGYACHNTVLSGQEINGDYAGFAQEALEKELPGATALFVAGCGGDANPLPRRSVELASMYGRILATAVREVVGGKMRPVAGPLRTAFDHVDLPFQTPPARQELQARLNDKDAIRRQHARHLLEILDR